MAVNVIRAGWAHVLSVAASMRQADVEECALGSGRGPHAAVLRSVEASAHTWAVVDRHGDTLSIFGVAPVASDEGLNSGCVWMLSSTLVERRARDFIRACRPEIAKLLEEWDELRNFISARNTLALRWAEWAGFQIGEPIPYGVQQQPFHPVRIRSPHV